ncbi:MAG: TrkH family potassium uptake protein [Paraprevotella sp.]|nr:TrkH family potassium uptake protein [Paraprevotella sp.]
MEHHFKEKEIAKRVPFYDIVNAKLIAYVIGILLWVEGGMLLICMGVSLLYHEDSYIYFLYATGINLIIGGGLMAYGKGTNTWITRRDGYCVVTFTWLMFSLLGMLPFYMSGEISTLGGAFMETMSGFTTTGFTVIDHLDTMPKGMLFWRALTQWVGGLGIVCFTIALLPVFGGGSLQLFSAEATGVTHDKLHPKISMTTQLLWTVYILLTTVLVILLYIGGVDVFDGICHAFSIMGTGGYSTKQASIAYWNSPFVEYVTSVFMIFASLNFSMLVVCLKGKFSRLFKDGETRWFIGSVLIITFIITLSLHFQLNYPVEKAFRKALFQVSTIHTSCGLATDDYTLWPQFTWMLLIFAMIAGGCTGSTAGGIKNMRIMLMFHAFKNELKQLIHSHAVLPIRINEHVIPPSLLKTVSTFTLFYLLCGFAGCTLLTFFGINFLEAFTSSFSCLGNVGLGFGIYGPNYTMSSMPEVCKWIVSMLMFIGRLELFNVLILFSPVYWKEW